MKTVERRSQTGTQLSSLYISLALLGIAALASAATSSLIIGLGGAATGLADPAGNIIWISAASSWAAGILSGIYCLSSLAYAFVSFRKGALPNASALRLVVALAAGVHLIGLLEGLWRWPTSTRTFDVTVASLLVLELSVIAVLGWRRNTELRIGQSIKFGKDPSAMAVVGSLFAASILVAGITTVGMAASTAGELAVPHSGHKSTENSPGVPSNIEQLKNQGHHH
ncbi:hypothetical protein [Arthrobacter sp. TWP1-1]|uniref:hypothetical protein n=1 Tax=Arthrobacter sp. TWP1-1 TaxID=2804568 RepID=UPI003CF3D42A